MDVNLNIEKAEIDFVKSRLKGITAPVELDDIVYQTALFKTRHTRSHKVKLYDPQCEYKVGDLIYKEYPGKIPVGSKKYIEMEAGVVLSVLDTRTRFGINEIKLKYDGTSQFKKYTDYLERQKIELLLPHKQSRPIKKAEYLEADDDPRKDHPPLEKRDLNTLKRKLISALNRESDLVLINRRVLQKRNIKSVPREVFKKIKDFLNENKKSESTEFFVENFLKVKPEDEDFGAFCFALNYIMQKDFKIDFQQTREAGWGKWCLISVIYYMRKDSPISEANPLLSQVTIADKKNIAQRRRKFEENLFQGVTNRFFLTQREITAGAVRLKPGFYDLGESIEQEVIDSKQKKTYLVYYYKDSNLMLGFKEAFERYSAQQGSILTFERAEDGKLYFNLRTTKKGTISDQVEYDSQEKMFRVTEEKVASPVFVNKAMFLEPVVFQTLAEKIRQFRSIRTFNKLVHKIFLEFGVKERNYEIHILRLYHILDLVYPVEMKLLEEVLLGNEEFIEAEKMEGVFYLDSDAVTGIEEEDLKRKEIHADESKKRKEEKKKKKIETERREEEEKRLKREERRRKREEEMWEKERMKDQQPEGEAPSAQESEPVVPMAASPASEPVAEKPAPPKPKQDFTPESPPEPPQEEAARKKAAAPKRSKKKATEEKPAKGPRKTDRRPEDENLTIDEIKSRIELENLKEQIKKPAKATTPDKKKIAYKDNGGIGGGIFSQLDQIVKKEDTNEDKKEDKKKEAKTKK